MVSETTTSTALDELILHPNTDNWIDLLGLSDGRSKELYETAKMAFAKYQIKKDATIAQVIEDVKAECNSINEFVFAFEAFLQLYHQDFDSAFSVFSMLARKLIKAKRELEKD